MGDGVSHRGRYLIVEQKRRQEERRAKKQENQPQSVRAKRRYLYHGDDQQDRNRKIEQHPQTVQRGEFGRQAGKTDPVEAEETQDSGHGRYHQGASFPDRARSAARAGRDEAQEADVLLLVVPELPTEEEGEQVAA